MKSSQNNTASSDWPPRLDALIQSAEYAFARGDFCLFSQLADKPQGWTIKEVELARALVREEVRWVEYVEGRWSGLVDRPDQLPSPAQLEGMGPEEREWYDLFTAWTRPLVQIFAGCQAALLEPTTLFSLSTYTSHSPGLDWSTSYEVITVT